MIQRIATTAFLCILLVTSKQAYGSQDDPGFSRAWIQKLVQCARQDPGPDDKFKPVSDEEIEVALGLSSKDPRFGRFKNIYGGTAQKVYEAGILKQKIGIDYRSMQAAIAQAGHDAEEIKFDNLQITLPVAYPPQFYDLKKLTSLTFRIAPGGDLSGDLNRPVDNLALCSFRLIAEVESLRSLGVDCPSKSFPVGFGLCKQLTELRVQTGVYNVFVDLSEDLFELTNLEKLDVSTCQIKAIPHGIGRLQNLVELNISVNAISDISDQIGNLVKLRILNAVGNRPFSLPSTVTQLSALENLNLGFNAFNRLPFLLREGVFPQLKILSLCGTNTSQLPANFAELSALEELYAGDNPLKSLPDTLHQMSQLTTLDLARLMVEETPSSACLPAIWKTTSLTYLRLEGCKFGVLPQEIGGLVNLTRLNLKNAFTMDEFSPVLYTLTSLTELDVSTTGLKTFPLGLSAFRHLEKLMIGNNLYGHLCEAAPNLPCLKSLDLGNSYDHRTTNLSKLPDWIGGLRTLESLAASNCSLSEIPESIGQLTRLTSLILCNQKGGLKALPASIVNLRLLEFLNIDKDGVETLPHAIKLLVDSGQLNLVGFTGQFSPPAGWWCAIQ